MLVIIYVLYWYLPAVMYFGSISCRLVILSCIWAVFKLKFCHVLAEYILSCIWQNIICQVFGRIYFVKYLAEYILSSICQYLTFCYS